jgi:hypothetical protein
MKTQRTGAAAILAMALGPRRRRSDSEWVSAVGACAVRWGLQDEPGRAPRAGLSIWFQTPLQQPGWYMDRSTSLELPALGEVGQWLCRDHSGRC